MLFTDGRLQSFEQMMKQPPHHHHHSHRNKKQSQPKSHAANLESKHEPNKKISQQSDTHIDKLE